MIRTDKLVIIVVLVLFFVIGLNRLFFIERWQNYERKPYKRVNTGSNPLGFYQRNGFAPVDEIKKEIKKATAKDISDKVVKLKPKRKKNVKKAKKKV